MTNTSEKVKIGAVGVGAGQGAEFQGEMDNIRLYNRVLSAAEVTELFNEGHS
jgi:hypothetical protein